MPTSAQIIAAYRDSDIAERLSALAAKQGIASPDQWVALHLRQLVAVDVDGDGPGSDSVASVYEYAVSQTPKPVRAGQNPSLVTDDLLLRAIAKVDGSGASSPS